MNQETKLDEKHYTNQQIADNITAIADALVEVIKNREKINSVINEKK